MGRGPAVSERRAPGANGRPGYVTGYSKGCFISDFTSKNCLINVVIFATDNEADQTRRGKDWKGGELGPLDSAQAELCAGSGEARVQQSAAWVLENI